MILYLLKSATCAALLFLVYHFLLEKEKMHRFNRLYLLGSIVLSFIIPQMEIGITQPPELLQGTIIVINSNFTSISHQGGTVIKTTSLLPFIIAGIYGIVTLLLLCRFIIKIAVLYTTVRRHPSLAYGSARLVFTTGNPAPHSFLHYIFVDKESFGNCSLKEEVLQHELTHVQQKHSLDILFIEALLVFLWFNPFLYLYRKAIKLNHEFLADEAVVSKYQNPAAYQYLLLSMISRASGLSLTSRLNYSITKKRLAMINKHTSAKSAVIKQLLLLPVAAALVFLFGATGTAQQPAKSKPPVVFPQTEASKTPAPQNVVEEYQAILKSYNIDTNEVKKGAFPSITETDRNKLETLFKKMSREQQQQQVVGFMPSPPPSAKLVPTEKIFNAFKNPNVYGVWIDDKKIANEALDQYKATDFSFYTVSKLYGKAKEGKAYTHQLNLMTNAHYKQYYADAMARKNKLIMYIKWVTNRTHNAKDGISVVEERVMYQPTIVGSK